jgi:hypothetical protein
MQHSPELSAYACDAVHADWLSQSDSFNETHYFDPQLLILQGEHAHAHDVFCISGSA